MFCRRLDQSQVKCQRTSTEALRNIRETCKRTEEERRRLELESGLYKRWRYGLCDDILLEAKSDHTALAKMNWLDKQVTNRMRHHGNSGLTSVSVLYLQIAQQVEKEKADKESEERQLRLRMEDRKHQELLSARKLSMEAEIAELKQFQEKHLIELKLREQETDKLHSDELRLRQNQMELADELTKLEIQTAQRHERIRCPHNLRRIKMLLRERSDAIRKDLRFDIDLLDRIPCTNHNQLQIQIVREKFEMQYDLEIQKQTQIEAMYESEAKMELLKQQEIWLKDSSGREKQLRGLLKEQQQIIEAEIDFVVRKQLELVEIRENHRAAIANATERIKHLQNMDEVLVVDGHIESSQRSTGQLADHFQDKVALGSDANQRPKYGRKKVAWT